MPTQNDPKSNANLRPNDGAVGKPRPGEGDPPIKGEQAKYGDKDAPKGSRTPATGTENKNKG